jgi:hypothetical protein
MSLPRQDDEMSDTNPAAGWARLLDRLSTQHVGQVVTIELLDSTYGDQYEAERLPFAYAAYDSKDDTVIIAVGGRSPRYPVTLRHMISHPTDVSVSDVDPAREALRVIDADGTATLVRFFPATA